MRSKKKLIAGGKPKTDQEYIRLDDAIATMRDWEREIGDELIKRNIHENALHQVIDAMRRIHSPDDE